jgi:hypothetical protein
MWLKILCVASVSFFMGFIVRAIIGPIDPNEGFDTEEEQENQ